jgi:hypothetical protein
MLKKGHRETDRFKGLIELTHNMGEEEYNRNPHEYNIDKPPKNNNDYLKLRKKLTATCQEYSGFMNDDGFLTLEPPFGLDNYDFIQRLFDSLHSSYRYQNLQGIITSRSEYVSTEVEKYAQHLKSVELRYADLEASYSTLTHKYDRVMRYPRMVKKALRLHNEGKDAK